MGWLALPTLLSIKMDSALKLQNQILLTITYAEEGVVA